MSGTSDAMVAAIDDRRLDMWRRVRARLTRDDRRAPLVDAVAVVRAVGCGSAPPDGGSWTTWEGFALRALYLAAIGATGGPDGCGPWLEGLDPTATFALRRTLQDLVGRDRSGGGELTEPDGHALERLAPVDQDCDADIEALAAGGHDTPTNERVVDRLVGHVAAFDRARAEPELSDAGRRAIGWKAANATEWRARGAERLGDDEAAARWYVDAAVRYEIVDEPESADRSRELADACDQRLAPDVDALVGRAIARLDALPSGSLTHVEQLVALARLCAGQSDLVSAREWADKAAAALAAQGRAVADVLPVEPGVIGWCASSAAPGSGRFLAELTRLLRMQAGIAAVRFAVDGAGPAASAHEGVFAATAAIAGELPAELDDVGADLDAGLVDFPLGPGIGPRGGATEVGAELDRGRVLAANDHAVDAVTAVLAGTGDPAGALAATDEAIALARAGGHRDLLAFALQRRARLELVAGRDEAAEATLRESLALTTAGTSADDRDSSVAALAILMEVFAGRGDWTSLDTVAAQAIDAVQRDRDRINTPFLQASYLARFPGVLVGGLLAAFHLGDVDHLLARIEVAKGYGSLRALAAVDDAAAESSPGVDELTAQIRELGDRIDRARSEQSDALAGLIDRRRRLWDLRCIAGRGLRATPAPFSLAALQAALEPDEAAVSYYWLDPTVLLVVTVTASATAVERRILGADQRAVIDGFVAAVATMKGANLGLEAAFIAPLAPVLLPDEGMGLLDGVRRLVVSPHRELHWFPFQALPLDGAPLVQRFAVRYAPNLGSVLLAERSPAGDGFVGIAVSRFGAATGLGDLHGVDEELDLVATAYRERGAPSTTAHDSTRADVDALRSSGALASAAYLQLSTHGSPLAHDAPMEAMIHLADGHIDGLDISLWDLRCDTVVLGACDAGQLAIAGRDGDASPGDEMFGLPAAMLAAGARAVLASTWPIDDETAKILIPSWHRHVLAGAPADVALQRAQLELLAAPNPKRRRAYYWAPYFLLAVGRPRRRDVSLDPFPIGAAHG